MKKLSFLFIAAIFSINCFAQKAVELRLNLPKGKTFEQNMEMKMNMKMEFQGMKIDTDVPFSSKISYKVVDIQNNNFVLECAYKSMKFNFDIMGQKISYNSDDKKQNYDNNPIAKVLSAFIGKPFKMTLDNCQNVVKIEGIDKLFNFDGEQKAQMEAMLKGIFSEDKIKENFSSANIIFPKEPVYQGFTWTTETSQNLQGMNMLIKNNYKVEKITAKTVEISADSDYSMDFSVNQDGQDVNVKMQNSQSKSFYVVDLQTGWTVSSKSNADMEMIMTTSQLGIEISIPMQLTMEVNVK